jgi:hypothetical protein
MDYHISAHWLTIIILLAIWEAAWKALALWRAAKNNQPGWFVLLIVVNSVGVLPIIYIIIHKNKH